MRLVTRTLLLLPALYLAALALIWWQQRSLMYVPNPAQISPETAGFPGIQVTTLTTQDNQKIISWYRPATDGKPTILYFHGNGGNLGGEGKRLAAMTQGGYGLFAIDYRGYGGSTGYPTEVGLLMDAQAAFVRLQDVGIEPEQTIVYGQSLGTGIAVDYATRHQIRAMVLEAPYSATVDVAEARFWMFPVRALMIDQFRSNERIAKVSAPILMLHGEGDATIPLRFGQRLFAMAPEPKRFISLPGAGHLLLLLPGVADQIHAWMENTAARN